MASITSVTTQIHIAWESFLKFKRNMQKSAVVEVRSEQMPDGKMLLKTESNLDLTINKCHIFAEKDA